MNGRKNFRSEAFFLLTQTGFIGVRLRSMHLHVKRRTNIIKINPTGNNTKSNELFAYSHPLTSPWIAEPIKSANKQKIPSITIASNVSAPFSKETRQVNCFVFSNPAF